MHPPSPAGRLGAPDRSAAFAGCRHFPAPVHDSRSLEGLTHREHEVLALLGSGASNRQISRRLNVTERTVKAHVTRILEKLQVRSRLEAALVVVVHHWTEYGLSGGSACGCAPGGAARARAAPPAQGPPTRGA